MIFDLTAEQWLAFLDRLDQPAEEKPELRKLMSEPTVFEED
jgi:uncharacterized protein (DUF1778 family)